MGLEAFQEEAIQHGVGTVDARVDPRSDDQFLLFAHFAGAFTKVRSAVEFAFGDRHVMSVVTYDLVLFIYRQEGVSDHRVHFCALLGSTVMIRKEQMHLWM